MLIKTSILTGAALNCAVAKALKLKVSKDGRKYWERVDGWSGDDDFLIPDYVNNWECAGPLLTKARISRTIDHSGQWIAYWTDGYGDGDEANKFMHCDRSELVAGMRCYVASKLGDIVEVPDELVIDQSKELTINKPVVTLNSKAVWPFGNGHTWPFR